MTVQITYLLLLCGCVLLLIMSGVLHTTGLAYFGASVLRTIVVNMVAPIFALGFVILGDSIATLFHWERRPLNPAWIQSQLLWSVGLFALVIYIQIQLLRAQPVFVATKILQGFEQLPRAFWHTYRVVSSQRSRGRGTVRGVAGDVVTITPLVRKYLKPRYSIPLLVLMVVLAVLAGVYYALHGLPVLAYQWALLPFPCFVGWLCSASIHNAWAQRYRR